MLTSGTNLNIRSGPSTAYGIIGSAAPNSTVSFDCYVEGQAQNGPYGTETAWDHLTSGGYVSDAWVYTGSNAPVVGLCGGASASYPIAFTGGSGVYPRAGTSMNSAKVGGVLNEGTRVAISCETYGETVTDSAGYTLNIWDKLTNGTYVANAYLNTGVNGRTPGVPTCSAPPPPAQTVTPCLFSGRWNNPQNLTVDYAGAHRYYGNAYQAVQNWNNVNAGVHLTITKGDAGARIHLVDVSDRSRDSFAQAEIPSSWGSGSASQAYVGYPPSSVAIKHPTSMRVILNRGGMDRLDDAHRTFAISHELGHIFGLAHSDQCTSSYSLMWSRPKANPFTRPTAIQPYDVAEMRLWYGRS